MDMNNVVELKEGEAGIDVTMTTCQNFWNAI